MGTIIASFQTSAVSYLYYADRIYQINLAIAGIAIGVVVLPQLSKTCLPKKKDKVLKIQNKALELSLFLSLPASIALFIGSEEIISALFGYGSFSNEAVLNSARSTLLFWFRFASLCVYKSFFYLFFFANNDTKTPFYISLISVIYKYFYKFVLF